MTCRRNRRAHDRASEAKRGRSWRESESHRFVCSNIVYGHEQAHGPVVDKPACLSVPISHSLAVGCPRSRQPFPLGATRSSSTFLQSLQQATMASRARDMREGTRRMASVLNPSEEQGTQDTNGTWQREVVPCLLNSFLHQHSSID